MEDIEDCAGPGLALSPPRPAQLLPRALRPRRRHVRTAEEAACGDSFIPGSQRVYLKTWGCTHNTSDGEYMAGMLVAAGYTITGRRKPRPLVLT